MLSRAVRRAALPLCVLGSPLALCALSARPLLAQEPTAADTTQQRVHTVKKHDTLWDIAKMYLGDPFQWPEIYRVNRDVVENPHWIYPGEKLRIPGHVVAEAPPAERAQVAEVPAAEAPTAEAPEEPEVVAAGEPTIFARETRRRAAQRAEIERQRVAVPPRVRAGEYVAAPWVDRRGGPRESGRIIEVNDMAGIAQHSGRSRLQGFDDVLISPPANVPVHSGVRYVSYELGPYIDDVGQIVMPTGVLEVVSEPRAGEALVARVVQVFGDMRTEQHLVAYDTSVTAIKGTPRPVEDGRTVQVRWISDQPVLPTMQNYVIVDLKADQGVRPGDEFSLFRPRTAPNAELPIARPEIFIARGEVVRVTPFGSTVLLTHIDQPKIETGTKARLSAKMP